MLGLGRLLPIGRRRSERIIRKCTANDTSQRYQQVTDLIADVERVIVLTACSRVT